MDRVVPLAVEFVLHDWSTFIYASEIFFQQDTSDDRAYTSLAARSPWSWSQSAERLSRSLSGPPSEHATVMQSRAHERFADGGECAACADAMASAHAKWGEALDRSHAETRRAADCAAARRRPAWRSRRRRRNARSARDRGWRPRGRSNGASSAARSRLLLADRYAGVNEKFRTCVPVACTPC
jgi:hypothetical protein